MRTTDLRVTFTQGLPTRQFHLHYRYSCINVLCQLGTGQSNISKNTGNVRILKNVKN